MKSFIQPRPWLAAVIGLTSALSCVTVSAQTAPPFPGKAITMVVPFPPGGVADIVARPVAEAMGRELGQAVVIENKPGAGGGIGMGQVAKAKPDGYTVLMALSSLSVIPEADALVGRPAMYGHTDLRPIARYTADPTVLAVRADAPWKTAKDFVDDAAAAPRPSTMAHPAITAPCMCPWKSWPKPAALHSPMCPSPARAQRYWPCWAGKLKPSPPGRRPCCST